jgi:hypothetical protein
MSLGRTAGATIVLSIGLAACGGTAGNSAATPTPKPTPPFVASDCGFRAVFPATPQRQSQNLSQTGLSLTMTLYTVTTNDEQLVVGCENLPSAPTGAAVQAGLDGGINGSAKEINGTIVSRSNTTFVGQPAEDGVIQAQGGVSRERVVFVGTKLYILETVTRTLDAKHPAYDRLLATFQLV